MAEILIAARGQNMPLYFPEAAMAGIGRLGNARVLDLDAHWSEADLIAALGDAEICMTHWGCPCFTQDVLDRAPKLRLIAHCTGSVANLVSPAVYDRGIKVCSANDVMALYVAEGALAYMLAGLIQIPLHDKWMKQGQWKHLPAARSLHGAKIGMVGLGAVGRHLLHLLKPFGPSVRIFDPYITANTLDGLGDVSLCTLEEGLAWGDVVSLHASLTKETRGMIDAGRLRLIRDGAVLVNTARGAIIDEQALATELATGRFVAVLDVYEREPLPSESPLRKLENAILMPHIAGLPVGSRMTFAMIEEAGRFLAGLPLQHEIPCQRFLLMTKE